MQDFFMGVSHLPLSNSIYFIENEASILPVFEKNKSQQKETYILHTAGQFSTKMLYADDRSGKFPSRLTYQAYKVHFSMVVQTRLIATQNMPTHQLNQLS
jgi:hypothetical protein